MRCFRLSPSKCALFPSRFFLFGLDDFRFTLFSFSAFYANTVYHSHSNLLCVGIHSAVEAHGSDELKQTMRCCRLGPSKCAFFFPLFLSGSMIFASLFFPKLFSKPTLHHSHSNLLCVIIHSAADVHGSDELMQTMRCFRLGLSKRALFLPVISFRAR